MVQRLCLIVLLFVVGSESAAALPVFARRYQTACTTCHVIIPKLNPFGIAFRNNGYRIPVNDEAFIKIPDVSLGAPGWKQLWPKAVWPGAIQGMPPIAVRVSTDVEITPNQPTHLNFNFPSTLGLYFAGPAGDTFSFFGHVVLQGSTNSIFLDRAYGQFRLQPEKAGTNLLNLKLGRIDTRAEPFASSFRKPSVAQMNVGEYRAVADGFGFRDHDAGIELWGAATGPDNRGGFEYGVGVVQGTNGRPESNNSKDFYWSGQYKFGGLGVAGSRTQDTSLGTGDNYSEWSLGLGAFGYRGKKRMTAPNPTAEDQFTRVGVKFDAYLDDLNILGAFVSGHDNLRTTTAQSIKTTAYFVQADYMLLPWLMPSLRLEKTNYSAGRRAQKALIGTAVLSIRANVRAVVEGRFYGSGQAETNDGVIRLDFLF